MSRTGDKSLRDLNLGYKYAGIFCILPPQSGIKMKPKACYGCLEEGHTVHCCEKRVGEERWCLECRSAKHWTSTCNKTKKKRR
mmetsp:Transcript_31535/g.40549  ORF Transcript_31535/g.40549 Transcript_31535/m.40549 type:complete len:83 (+) Transcript_31535:783-1031(+)